MEQLSEGTQNIIKTIKGGKMKLKYILPTLFTLIFLLNQPALCQSNIPTKKAQLKKEIRELTRSSDLVVVGKIQKMYSGWNKQKTRIYTTVTVQVEDYVKGTQTGSTILVTHLGGEVDGVGELYSHTPKFTSQEEVMLFLHKNKEGNLIITKGDRGKFNLHKNASLNIKTIGTGENIDEVKNIVRNNSIKK